MAKCRWCAGDGKECGCGYGYCAHCGGSGELPDPPFGMPPNPKVEDSIAITLKQLTEIVDWWFNTKELVLESKDLVVEVDYVLFDGQTLTVEEVETFAAYFDNQYRDETIGEFICMVADYIYKKKCQ